MPRDGTPVEPGSLRSYCGESPFPARILDALWYLSFSRDEASGVGCSGAIERCLELISAEPNNRGSHSAQRTKAA